MRISPSGGKYIGQTVKWESDRWYSHKHEAFDKAHPNYNCLLSKAIRKYGADNFEKVILENNIPTEKLDEREIYWIEYHKSYYKDGQHGYNMTRGGYGKERQYNIEDIMKLWNEGKCILDIAKMLNACAPTISTYLKANGITNEEIEERRKSSLAIKNTPSKKIYQYTLEGTFIKEYNSLTSIRKEYACTNAISRVCRDKQYSAYGFIWSYIKDDVLIKKKVELLKEKKKK